MLAVFAEILPVSLTVYLAAICEIDQRRLTMLIVLKDERLCLLKVRGQIIVKTAELCIIESIEIGNE